MTREAKRRPSRGEARLVEVSPVASRTAKVVIRAMGSVMPARTVDLASRVRGQVVSADPRFVPGGFFRAGEQMLKVEATDYELAVRQRESDLTKVQTELKIEMGRQAVARREYELLEEEMSQEERELLLREPHLATAEAAVAAAEAALEQAEVSLADMELLAARPKR